MIPLLLLSCVFLFAFFRPRGGAMLVALTAAFWLEWRLPVGIRLSVFEAAFLGGLCGLAVGDRFHRGIAGTSAVVAFILANTISVIWTHTQMRVDEIVWIFVKSNLYPLSFFLFYLTLDDEASLEKALRLLLLSATAAALIGLAQFFTGRPLSFLFIGTYSDMIGEEWLGADSQGRLRAFSTLGDPTLFGQFMVLPLSIAVGMLLASQNWRQRKWLLLGVAFMSLGLMVSLTRAAWIAFAVSYLLIGWRLNLFKQRWFWPFVVSGVILFVGAVKLNLLPGVISGRLKSLQDPKDAPSMLPRYVRWEYYFNRSLETPWLGHGIVSDEAAVEALENAAVSPHNTYIELAVARGWLTAGMLGVLIFKLWRNAWRLSQSREAPYRGVGIGLFCGALGTYLVGAMFDSLYQDSQGTVVFWLCFALALRYAEMSRTAGQSAGFPSDESEPMSSAPDEPSASVPAF